MFIRFQLLDFIALLALSKTVLELSMNVYGSLSQVIIVAVTEYSYMSA
jgi:hypothetical protein